MSAILAELHRLRSDRSARLGLAVGAATLYLLVVLAQDLGAGDDVVAALLAPCLVLWRRRPLVAVALGVLACIALPVAQLSTRWQVSSVGPLLLVVLPVLGAALDDRVRERTAALLLAALFPLCVGMWGIWTGTLYVGQPALLVSVAVLAALPVLAAAVWRRPTARAAAIAFVRERAPRWEPESPRFRLAVGVAVAAYLLAVGLGFAEHDLRPLVAAVPAAASIIWFRSRPDAALVLAAVGLLLVVVLAPVDPSFRTGLALTCLYAVVPVFGAATSGSTPLRQAGIGLVAVVALVGTLMTGTIGFGLVVLIAGGAPFLFALLAEQTRSSRRLRSRLRESEERGEVAERDVQFEQERNRIAREVHDVVAHSLAVVIAQADGARFASQTSPDRVAPALEAISDTARTALGEVRTMLHDLKQDGGSGDAPGVRDIGPLLDGVRELGVEVDAVTFGAPASLAHAADLAVFRIVQEALTNALRHGDRDAPVRVETDWGEQTVVVVVTNAIDPDAQPATERRGHGIPGMRERAELAGGECTAGAGSDGSFRVRVALPVPPPDGEAEAGVRTAAETEPEGGLAALLRLVEHPRHA